MKLFTNQSQRNAKLLRSTSLGLTLLFFGSLILLTDPVKLIADWQLTLRPGTLLYALWQVPPLDVYIKVHMFNYTNVDDFVAGRDAKLKVQEVGPYVYQEVLSNHNITLNEANNTITYTPRREYIFVPERSVGDPKLEFIYAPNIPYMGISTLASKLSMFTALGLSALTKKLNAQPMLHVSVHEYMWGYEDHLVHLASKFVPSLIDFSSFGIMEKLFREGNESNVVNMYLPERKDSRGIVLPDSPRGYSLDSINGEHGFKRWEYDEATNGTSCNRIRGSHDATLFPRDMNANDTFLIYRRTFCRLLPMKYNRTTNNGGIEGHELYMEPNIFDSQLHDPNTSCFCKNNQCLKRGVGNVSPCYYNMPLAITYPHFMHADPSLLDAFEGLQPDEERFRSSFTLNTQLGAPLRAHIRLQANQVVGDIKFNRLMEPFENLVLPLLWVDLTIDDLPLILRLLIHVLFNIGPILEWGLALLMLLVGIYQLVVALLLCMWPPTSHQTEHFKEASPGLAHLPNFLQKQASLNSMPVQEQQKLLCNGQGVKIDLV